MFDISAQISALILTWLRKLAQNQNLDYYEFCIYNIESLEKMIHMGQLWCKTIINKTPICTEYCTVTKPITCSLGI